MRVTFSSVALAEQVRENLNTCRFQGANLKVRPVMVSHHCTKASSRIILIYKSLVVFICTNSRCTYYVLVYVVILYLLDLF